MGIYFDTERLGWAWRYSCQLAQLEKACMACLEACRQCFDGDSPSINIYDGSNFNPYRKVSWALGPNPQYPTYDAHILAEKTTNDSAKGYIREALIIGLHHFIEQIVAPEFPENKYVHSKAMEWFALAIIYLTYRGDDGTRFDDRPALRN